MTEEINIKDLALDELFELMKEDLYDGLADEIVAEVNECLERDVEPTDILSNGLVAGMQVVGVDFRDGVIFVPEVLMAAKSMKAGMAILRPLLAETGVEPIGKAVIGTVKADIHDIGKNLVGMMWEGAGFEVVDIGINVDVDKFKGAVAEHNPDILGMSAMLTTTMPYMGVVIDSMKKERESGLTILVGGAPLNEAFAEDIRADAYCKDAAVAVETAKKFIEIKKG
ncbi:MAG: cobalamin-binding protein [Chloroflexi bacterium]|nr:MAG: cobalamin-binding protein [Chloroflexota bacterium]MBL1193799.1 cobalamin-binding protein [Chloroflexota bacterium]NOH11092.1 corrinoid protein [Chloroflexota bacterium]